MNNKKVGDIGLILTKTIEILVKGKIQKVGYRAKVMNTADKLNIKGEVENIEDGNVRIIAQTENEEKLNQFINQINIKNTLIDVSDVSVKSINTDKIYTDFKKIVKKKETDERLDSAVFYLKELIKVTKEGVGYSKQSVEYSKQSVEYSKQNVELTKENIEISKENLGLTKQGIEENRKFHSELIYRFDKLDNTLNKRFDVLDNLLNSFHKDTINRFDIVDAKYGKISENIEKAISSINRVSINIEKLLEKSERDRDDYKKSMQDIVGAILKLAKEKN
ncbi:MAG: hypothetical protein B6U87_00085 [Candidatus Aenigmarchaeota archaeon ex4484_52]|nr:MAG: hypothetical protein B6U87_00085 [Candidatus Aenigmarchaeota archaeon ex4484_52]